MNSELSAEQATTVEKYGLASKISRGWGHLIT